jgi:hypothetical protein
MQATIAAAVEEQTATTNEIARNVNNAASGTNEIATNIVLVSQQANSTSESATATGACATSVSEVSDDLALLLNGHRTNGSSEQPRSSTGGRPRRDFQDVPGRSRPDGFYRINKDDDARV